MNANEILGRLNKAVRNIIWIGDVYAFTLPPGEVYNTEPFGEVGPLNFVHHSISELKFAAALVTELADARANQKSAWYEARIAELERVNAALVAERDADELAPFGWIPGNNAESRTTVGAGYVRGEG